MGKRGNNENCCSSYTQTAETTSGLKEKNCPGGKLSQGDQIPGSRNKKKLVRGKEGGGRGEPQDPSRKQGDRKQRVKRCCHVKKQNVLDGGKIQRSMPPEKKKRGRNPKAGKPTGRTQGRDYPVAANPQNKNTRE